jgi:transcriptional regulator with XRE-family HTH domain
MTDLKISDFGERLLWLIKSNQLNQSSFANKLSVAPNFVSDLVRGIRKPGTEILIRIKNNFNVSIDWLLFGEENHKEEKIINIDLFKAIALRVDIVKAALSGNSQAISTLNAMCPSIKDKLITELSLSYTLDANQIAKDIDVINKLYVTFLNTQINDDLYKKIIESAVDNILENPIDPLLKMNQSNQPK